MLIVNKGQALESTDYWDSEQARAGFFFLSWNAGAARLLVPDCHKAMLREMRTADYVVVSRGPWTEQGGREAVELRFEDDSDSPFSVCLLAAQCDQLLPESDQGGGFDVVVWTSSGMKGRWPGRYRTVASLPCLDPWVTQ